MIAFVEEEAEALQGTNRKAELFKKERDINRFWNHNITHMEEEEREMEETIKVADEE